VRRDETKRERGDVHALFDETSPEGREVWKGWDREGKHSSSGRERINPHPTPVTPDRSPYIPKL
jgi:hypothetical protein